MSDEKWIVVRTDDAGNRFVIKGFLDIEQANKLVSEFTLRGHKQFYEVLPQSNLDYEDFSRNGFKL